MGTIKEAFDTVFRDYNAAGVPSSGAHDVEKSEARGLGTVLETAVGMVNLAGTVSVIKSTLADLQGDLAHGDGTVALVWNDPVDVNNDFYLKVGASGTGIWSNTGLLTDMVSGIAAPSLDAAAGSANSAAASALAAQLASGDAAGFAEDAQLSATAAGLARDQVASLVDPANIFVDVPLATAEAAVVEGEYFKLVLSAEGSAEIRLRTSGGSDLLYEETTTAALAAPERVGKARVRPRRGVPGRYVGRNSCAARHDCSRSRRPPVGAGRRAGRVDLF